MSHLTQDDPELERFVDLETDRLNDTVNLIAAENHCPQSVLQIMGSVFNTKTIEGYPGKRFHAGCDIVDQVEKLAIDRGKSLFGAEYINVQPHSGTSANLAVYFSVLNVNDPVLSMSLPHGGHLSHGHPSSITSKCFKFTHYGLDPETECIATEKIRELAQQVKPRMIVAGASAYPRLIDYKKIGEIAAEVGAFFLVDMAHLAGLVAAKLIPSPVPFCDFVTFTCYKTMMGGRGGVILSKKAYGKKIDHSVFPGCQGTSAVNSLAAKALIFKLATQKEFIHIQKKTLANAKQIAGAFLEKGYRIVSGGTDNHQVLVDLTGQNISGQIAESCLESVGIVLNRNVIPGDAHTPGRISGIRIGSGAVSARGMGPSQMRQIVDLADQAVKSRNNQDALKQIKEQVSELCRQFPVKDSL